jgi:hypothetical protein
MAKFLMVIEDADPRNPDGPVNIQVHQMLVHGEDPRMPTAAGKMTRYAQLRMAELELAAKQDREAAEGQRSEGAARCWH